MAKGKRGSGKGEGQYPITQANLDRKGKTNKKLKNNTMAAKYLTPKSLFTAVQGKYQLADPDCPTYGYVVADENTDLYCYTMMFLNYLYGENASKFTLEEYYAFYIAQ